MQKGIWRALSSCKKELVFSKKKSVFFKKVDELPKIC